MTLSLPIIPNHPGAYGAKYRCKGCGQEWVGHAGPNPCPTCHHVYVDWLNFEEMFRKRSGPGRELPSGQLPRKPDGSPTSSGESA